MIKKRRADTRDSRDDCPGYSVLAELKVGRGNDAMDASQLRSGFHAWPLNRKRLSHHHKLGFACETKSRTPKKIMVKNVIGKLNGKPVEQVVVGGVCAGVR